jgi:hypothetical protein
LRHFELWRRGARQTGSGETAGSAGSAGVAGGEEISEALLEQLVNRDIGTGYPIADGWLAVRSRSW